MNEAQREVLKKKHIELVQDLTVTEELLGICYQHKLFDHFMIETIRSQAGHYQQAAKLLEFLPKRGPNAFDKFLKVLESGHHWLADMLRSSLKQETEKMAMRSYLPKLEVSGDKVSSPRLQRQGSSSPDPSNPKIREKVEKFMSKQFSLNRRMSQLDKRAVEQFLTEQMEKSAFESYDEVDNFRPMSSEISETNQQWLHNMHVKLKVRIDALECDANMKEISKKTYTMETITTEVIEKQIDFVLNKLETYDSQVSQCYDVIGDVNRRRSLSLQFEDLIVKCNELNRELEKEKKKADKMSQEVYQISMDKKTSEHNNQLKEVQLEVKESQIHKIQSENAQLKREIERLNHLHMQHLEKQKTLHNLREMVNELQDSKNNIQEENESLKSKLNITEQDEPGKGLVRKASNNIRTGKPNNKLRVSNRKKLLS